MTARGRRRIASWAPGLAGRLAAARVSFALPVLLCSLLAFLLARTAYRLTCGVVPAGDVAGARETAEGAAADPTGTGSPAPDAEDLAGRLAAVRPDGGPGERTAGGEKQPPPRRQGPAGASALVPRLPAALALDHGASARWFLPARKPVRRGAEPFRARAPPRALNS
jgi:hypothetical protein